MLPGWRIEALDETVERELLALPAECQASFLRISELLIEHGPQFVGMPYIRPLGNKLWEMRLRGRGTIARAIYLAAKGRRLVVVHAFVKKGQKTPARALKLALERAKRIG